MNEKISNPDLTDKRIRVWDGLLCIEEQVAYLRRIQEAEVEMLERHVDGLKEKIERLERRLEEEK